MMIRGTFISTVFWLCRYWANRKKRAETQAILRLARAKRARGIIAGLECRLDDRDQFFRDADRLDSTVYPGDGRANK